MKLIVGLGNPGSEFDLTPHNVGFSVVDKIAAQIGAKFSKKPKNSALFAKGVLNDKEIVLIKPQTFMNASGDATFSYAKKLNLKPEDVLVVLDDFELSEGLVRARMDGTAGTHNGLKHIILRMGTTNIPRIRVGVGAPEPGQDYAKFVLSKMSGKRLDNVNLGVEKAEKLVADFVDGKLNATTM